MNIITLICFFVVVALFLFSVYRSLFVKDTPDMIAKWKIALILIIVSSIFFFIYFTSAIGELSNEQTLTDGVDTWTQKDTDYKLGFDLLPLVVAIYSLQWMYFIINILQGFSFFGRSRMSLE